jgi:cation transport protein ChaC
MAGDKPINTMMTREQVQSGVMRDMLRAADPSIHVWTDDEHRASVAATLASRPDVGGDVWLFAYGSLIWNPMIHFSEKRIATVHGYHRRFCLWTHLGRGSVETPGLILGLDYGGACRGLVYRISEAEAEAELLLLWQREMITGAYCPRWVPLVTKEGGRGWAIAFLINREHARYAGVVAEDRMVAAIARAKGPLGPCAAYLFDTASHLEALGIRDARLLRLRDLVAQAIEGQSKKPK